MLELLKLVVDVFTKAIPGIVGKRRTDKLADLGAKLFVLYVACNEMLLRGERIVALLAELDERGSIVDPSGKRVVPQYHDVMRLIHEQGIDLVRVTQAIDEWAPHLQILNGEAYNSLVLRLSGKGDDLDELVRKFRYPVPTGRITETDLTVDRRADNLPRELVMELSLLREGHGMPDEVLIFHGETIIRSVRAFLTERDPRVGLAAIRVSLEQLRAALIQNFTLEDILPKFEARGAQ